MYASAAKVQPGFNFDPVEPSVGRDIHARRQLAFARAVSGTDPGRALSLIAAITHDSGQTYQGRASVLRLVAEQVPSELAADIRQEAVRLLDLRGLNNVQDAQMAGDALVALGIVDPDLALQRSMAFPSNRRFLGSFIRVELALSWLPRNRAKAFEILETLDNEFWQGLADEAWKLTSRPASRDPSFRAIARVKQLWPREAVAVAAEDRTLADRTLRRFEEVARLLDTSIVKRLPGKTGDGSHFRAYWGNYVAYRPFALAELAVARQQLGRDDASRTFEEVHTIVQSAKSPAREWALVWNARAWLDAAPDRRRRGKGLSRVREGALC